MKISPVDQGRQRNGQFNDRQSPRTGAAQQHRDRARAGSANPPDLPASLAQHLQTIQVVPARTHMAVVQDIAERAGQPNTPWARFLISALLLGQLRAGSATLQSNTLSQRQAYRPNTANDTSPGLSDSARGFGRHRRTPPTVPQMPVSNIAAPAVPEEAFQYVVSRPVEREAVLTGLITLLQDSGMLPAERVVAFREDFQRMGNDRTILVSYVSSNETAPTLQRRRRIAINRRPEAILLRQPERGKNHNPCRIGITTPQGGRGDSYIVAGNYLENPFRDLLHNAGQPPGFWPRLANALANGATAVFTLGMKDPITFPIAHGLRTHGHLLNDQQICAREEWAPSQLAVWAASIAVKGRDPGMAMFNNLRPVTQRMVSAAALRNELIGVARAGVAQLVSVRDPVSHRYLKAIKLADGEHVVIDPIAQSPELKVRVLLANAAGDIHLFGAPVDEPLESLIGFPTDVVLADGHLLPTRNETFVARFLEHEQVADQVYRDAISGDSHLGTENGHSIFSPQEQAYIRRISIDHWFSNPDTRFVAVREPGECTASDSQGPIYRVYSAARGAGATVREPYQVVDLAGLIVPVALGPRTPPRRDLIDRLANRYPELDQQYYATADFGNVDFGPIEFDGYRWTLAKPTRPAIAPELDVSQVIGLVLRGRLADPEIKQHALKANGPQGLWLLPDTEQTYLKLDNRFIRVERGLEGFVATCPAHDIRIPLVLRRVERGGQIEEEYGLSWQIARTQEGSLSILSINSEGLSTFTGASHKMYAIDVRSPELVQWQGFSESLPMVMPSMLGREPIVELYESLEGVRRQHLYLSYRYPAQSFYIYEIDAEDLPGVSLNQNAILGLTEDYFEHHRHEAPELAFTAEDRFSSSTWREMVLQTGGGIFFHPVHIRAMDLWPLWLTSQQNRVRHVPTSDLLRLPAMRSGLWTQALVRG